MKEHEMTTIHEAFNKFAFPRSIVRRTQQRDLIDVFTTKTYDGKTVILNVYEQDNDKWFVVLTNAFAGWTRDAVAAFAVKNAVEFFTLAELVEMAR